MFETTIRLLLSLINSSIPQISSTHLGVLITILSLRWIILWLVLRLVLRLSFGSWSSGLGCNLIGLGCRHLVLLVLHSMDDLVSDPALSNPRDQIARQTKQDERDHSQVVEPLKGVCDH